MSQLILTVARCPDSAPVEERRVGGGEFSVGRGADCDWRLHDPARVLSKRHCLLEFSNGGWNVHDVSTNGTFLNHAATPIGANGTRSLSTGDCLTLGPYEIEVRIVDEPAAPRPAWSPEPWPATGVAGTPGPASASPDGAPLFPDDLQLTDDFGPVRSDHGAAISSAFKPPSAAPQPFPTDLDLGFEAPPPPPLRGPGTQAEAASAPATSAASALAASKAPSPPLPELNAAAVQRLLEAAGVSGLISRAADQHPDRVLENAGATLLELIRGVRALLVARDKVKREFRIQPTALRLERNNPIKFAATEQQALAALFDPDAPAHTAVRETVEDLVLHQAATLAATQAAARALLERMRPESFEAEATGAGLLPGSRERRLWEAYRRRHAQLVTEFEDDFDSAFGKAFARAYEEAAARGGVR